MINYFLVAVLSLGLSYGIYILILRPVKTFRFNRLYLMTTLVLCLIAPFLEFEVLNKTPEFLSIDFQNRVEATTDFEILSDKGSTQNNVMSELIYDILFYSYFCISLLLSLRFLRNLNHILKLTFNQKQRLGILLQINVSKREQPSSFFNYLFVNHKDLEDESFRDALIAHETIHARQLHALDVLLNEILICFFWFNPFVWLYKRAMIENHEFIADAEAVSSGIDIDVYSKNIIDTTQRKNRFPLTSGFNFTHIKKRIIMLHQAKSSFKNRAVRMFTALLLFSGIFIFSAFKEIKKPLVVVVDAGHGGQDNGNLNEKQIVLNISTLLASMQDEKIKIIQTRSDDKFMTLAQRTAFINSQNPDLYISLHCNSHTDSKRKGIEIYCSENSKDYKQSMGYGWLLLNKQLENGVFKNGEMKSANFYLLKNAKVPGLFMEMGFVSNPDDSNKLNSVKGRNEMAKAIYDGLLEIREKKELIDLLDKN